MLPLRFLPRALACALAVHWAGAFEAAAQVGPEQSARMLKPAEGLEVQLFAAEPMVLNPTNIDVDSRGRVWVTEGLNYRLYRNAKGEIARQGKADAVKILEDTDGDGRADKVTIFADEIYPVPMGIAVEEHWSLEGEYKGCRVFIGNSPNLLVLEDTDGDDRADKRSVLLTGFGGVDSDHGIHGMTLGLDGKLYFTHGDGCCSVQPDQSQKTQNFDVRDKSGRHVTSDQLANTLRANRDGTQFEILADRQRNNYEVALNAFGNLFVSDNDDDGNRGCRVIWVMEGGKYGYRTPGSPRHWGEEVPGNVPKLVGTGNGSPCGVMVYEGDLLPPRYRGAIFEAEAGTRQINSFPLEREGAAFRTVHDVLLASDDPWFRPVDVTAAPDGSVYVADWYDAGVGGHAFQDQTTGRIYRVAPKGSKPPGPSKPDFRTQEGRIAALKSPVVAAQDAARRLLIAEGPSSCAALAQVAIQGDPIHRARAYWAWHAVDGDRVAVQMLADDEPRIREQGVRILGRDVSRVGQVELADNAQFPPPRAVEHLDDLLGLIDDPDAGVRRELILAFQSIPTDKVGPALRRLAQQWDGRDRWYLEALGLALQGREPEFIASLFDGKLFDGGDDPTIASVALPPYFPADRNEAFLAIGDELPPATGESKTLGLAWRLRRFEAVPFAIDLLNRSARAEVRQAAEDVLANIADPQTAVRLAEIAAEAKDPARKQQMMATIARKLSAEWQSARENPKVVALIEGALAHPESQVDGLTLAGASRDQRYAEAVSKLLADPASPPEVRAAGVEALSRIKPPHSKEILLTLIAGAKGKPAAEPDIEAAVRALPQFGEDHDRLVALFTDAAYPLGLRREALRSLATFKSGAARILAMAKDKSLPDDLRTDAVTTLYGHPDREIRQGAEQVLPPLVSKSGKALPQIYELVRREGDAKRGEEIFHRVEDHGCASCHRVQGHGEWVGPDLSTIGVKYGKDELIRSILNPNAAIGYNYRSVIAVLDDGRVLTGLPVEETASELVLKTAEGKRERIPVGSIEERRLSDVSLMPEGLVANFTEEEFVDLVSFLSTLRRPVSVVGQFQVKGPVPIPDDAEAAVHAAGDWRRVDANAESAADLTPFAGKAGECAIVRVPVSSAVAQPARLILESEAKIRAILNGQAIDLGAAGEIQIPAGPSELVLIVEGGPPARLVVTFVAERPLEFREPGH